MIPAPWNIIIPAVGALGLLTATYIAGRDHGRDACEARWQVAQAEAVRQAVDAARKQQSAVVEAEAADVQERVIIREKLVPIREEIIRYAETQPDGRDCVDGNTRSLLSEAIRAANSATTAGGAATGR